MIKIFTIGVYNSTESSFFKKLISNNIDLFCDIRQRRGVRGAQYKYVNSNYLQDKLKELNIEYEYIKDLAPTNEIRQKQKDVDKHNGESKKQRLVLGNVNTKLKFVGFQTIIPYIPKGTIIRLSLANWWNGDGSGEDRCYLQLSGWYM